ncbi:MAG: SpoVR family protein [Spirochaetales bacterium]|nr:SpoVR family protein [Spirochaetales bacterium]
MQNISQNSELNELYHIVMGLAKKLGRKLPEIRFFILDGLEFVSLLEKRVYPTSPLNIWEGKRMVTRKYRIKTGMESTLYYEVVQTGNPSYAYLNNSNSPMIQASVMAHVCGHCEFSEVNVLKDSNPDRTEYVMYLTRKVDLARSQMGEHQYLNYWNACESVLPLIAPHSQHNLDNSVDTETAMSKNIEQKDMEKEKEKTGFMPVSTTLSRLIQNTIKTDIFKEDAHKKKRKETLSRVGYTLKAPCQDILGFLRGFAPASKAERSILDYLYIVHIPHDFVLRTQIMNEGWAMYWEKKIMLELFKEKAVKGIIDYARIFSGVCFPRPYFMRNPYHLGYNLWNHIEGLYRDGKVCLEYTEEKDLEKKKNWKKVTDVDPVGEMEHLVATITDYEFLRRFLTPELIHSLHLNRLEKRYAEYLRLSDKDIYESDDTWVWLNPEPVREEMLRFYTHFGRPRIYIIDTDFQDGGLLLYHRDDKRELRKDWIKPTLRNLNIVWKNSIYLISRNTLYSYAADRYKETIITPLSFEEVSEKMYKGAKPFKLE